ncbi:MAG: 4Fe-4S binding protein [Bacteroidota bacterium]
MRHLFNARRHNAPIYVSDPGYFSQKPGRVTLEYPFQKLPVPDVGRYALHNEMDDCIVCDKCAKVCPVDCIEIEPIKSATEFGKTSDGTAKRLYAAKFNIDMAKCCFCGLCTTVCPTECLTMTREFDISVTDMAQMNVPFGNLTEAEAAEKQAEYAAAMAAKAKPAPKAEATPLQLSETSAVNPEISGAVDSAAMAPVSKPGFRPFKKPVSTGITEEKPELISDASKEIVQLTPPVSEGTELKPKSVFKPFKKPSTSTVSPPDSDTLEPADEKPATDSKLSPVQDNVPGAEPVKPKPVFKPFKKPAPKTSDNLSVDNLTSQNTLAPAGVTGPEDKIITGNLEERLPGGVNDTALKTNEAKAEAPNPGPAVSPRPAFKPFSRKPSKPDQGENPDTDKPQPA